MGREICRASLETEGIELEGGTLRAGASELGSELVKDTLNVLLKYEGDIEAALG